MRILIIEDDVNICKVLTKGLSKEYEVFTANDGDTGLEMALDGEWAAIILDIMLPGKDGYTICETLREKRNQTPILMLTACDAIEQRVEGLEIGADDYLVKPFEFSELNARIRALIRRNKTQKGKILTAADGNLEINVLERRVTVYGTDVHLTFREYDLLNALVSSAGTPLTRDVIQYRVWNNDDTTSNTVDAFIKLLRKKIEQEGKPQIVQTIHGVGYMIKK